MLALVLSIIGVYAVVAYATAAPPREIAVRLALGADSARIVSLVMRQGAVWIGAGLLTGIVGARLLTGYVPACCSEVTQNDVVTFAVSCHGPDRDRVSGDRHSRTARQPNRSDAGAQGGVGVKVQGSRLQGFKGSKLTGSRRGQPLDAVEPIEPLNLEPLNPLNL